MAYDDRREVLSVEECAKETGISRAKLYEFIMRGGPMTLPTIKLGDRRLIRRQSLQEWLAMLEQHTAGNDDVHQRDREAASKARSKRGQGK